MTKNWRKKIQLKVFISFFDQKLRFPYPLASLKNVQATEEAFSPQKRTSSTLKNEIYWLSNIFVGHFWLHGSGSRDPIESTTLLFEVQWNTSWPFLIVQIDFWRVELRFFYSFCSQKLLSAPRNRSRSSAHARATQRLNQQQLNYPFCG